MASYSFEWRKSTKKDLRRLPTQEIKRIIEAVETLVDDPFPHGSEKLSGSEHAYRIRIGDYRVVYEVFTSVLLVEIQRIAHRKDVYKK
jgi:mRNA interferase RelE/StbE